MASYYGISQERFPDLETRLIDLEHDLFKLRSLLYQFSDEYEVFPLTPDLVDRLYRYHGVLLDFLKPLDSYSSYFGELSASLVSLSESEISSGLSD